MAKKSYSDFIKYAEAIAYDIPTEDGDLLGPALVKKNGSNFFLTCMDLTDWLQQIGFNESDAYKVISLATFISFKYVFSNNKE